MRQPRVHLLRQLFRQLDRAGLRRLRLGRRRLLLLLLQDELDNRGFDALGIVRRLLRAKGKQLSSEQNSWMDMISRRATYVVGSKPDEGRGGGGGRRCAHQLAEEGQGAGVRERKLDSSLHP